MAVKILTDPLVRSLKAPAKGRLEISDAKVPGLVLRVTPAGVRSWSYRYHDRIRQRVERLSLGRFPAVSLAKARELAERQRAAVVIGESPRETVRKQKAEHAAAISVNEFLDRYQREYIEKRTPKSAATTKSYLAAVRKALGNRKARDITRADVLAFLKERAETAAVASNRTRSILITAFNFAIDHGILENTPMVRIPKFGTEEPKERVVSDDELKILWSAFAGLGDSMALAFQTLVLLGQRPGEIVGLRLDELHDLKKPAEARIELPPERTKNGRRHVVPLPGTARGLIMTAIANRPPNEESPFVFVSWRNPGSHYDVRSFARAIKRIIADLEGGSEAVGTLQADYPTPHAFRRTMITGLSRLGSQREIVKAVVNHAEGDILERHYDRYDRLPEKRRALEAWESHVMAALGQKPMATNVIPFQG